MKQNILKRLLISGAAALGIMGLSTPAAFAWSGNSSYGSSYNNSSNMSYSHVKYSTYTSYEAESYSSSYNNSSNSYGNNEYGGNNHCRHLYVSHKNKWCDHYGNSYQSKMYD